MAKPQSLYIESCGPYIDFMPRQMILDKIKKYQIEFPEDSAEAQRLYDFIESTELAFHRENLEGHVTGSCLVVSPDKQKVLLTHHKKLNKWIQLGGHSDGEANTLNVSMREAEEESGISDLSFISQDIFSIDIHTIPARKQEPEHLHYDISFLIQAHHEDYTVSDESHDLQWFPVKELLHAELEDSLSRMIKRYNMMYL